MILLFSLHDRTKTYILFELWAVKLIAKLIELNLQYSSISLGYAVDIMGIGNSFWFYFAI
jgi:hypothetical protein